MKSKRPSRPQATQASTETSSFRRFSASTDFETPNHFELTSPCTKVWKEGVLVMLYAFATSEQPAMSIWINLMSDRSHSRLHS